MKCLGEVAKTALIRGTLSDREFANANAHLRGCDRCRAEVEALISTDATAAFRYVPDEELIAEIVAATGPPTRGQILLSGDVGVQCPQAGIVGWIGDPEHVADCAHCQMAYENAAVADGASIGSFMPSETLVAQILANAVVRRPRFRFPTATVRVREPDGRMKAVRVAAATLATFGVLPEVLAAAALTHIVGFALLGSWIANAVMDQSERRAVPPPASEQVVFIPLTSSRAVSAEPLGGRPSSVATARPARRDAGLRAEAMRVVNQTAVFSGSGGTLDSTSATGLERVITALTLVPGMRIELDVAAGDSAAGSASGFARAEVIRRLLLARGIRLDRAAVVSVPAPHSPCDIANPICPPRSGTVRIRVSAIGGKSPP